MKIKNNTENIGIIVGLTSVFGIQVVLKALEVSEISTQIYATIAVAVSITFSFIMIKDRNKGMGVKLNIAAAIVTSIACILTSVALIFIKCFPNLSDSHKILTIILVFSSLASFFALIIFWVIAATIVLKKKQH